jgi:hypothetical protein
MFTPEAVNEEEGTFTLVANHALEDPRARQLSVDYNLARIRYGLTQLPPRVDKCIVVYDIRGQRVSDDVIASLRRSFAHIHELRIWK